jgi:hypothetical protein
VSQRRCTAARPPAEVFEEAAGRARRLRHLRHLELVVVVVVVVVVVAAAEAAGADRHCRRRHLLRCYRHRIASHWGRSL